MVNPIKIVTYYLFTAGILLATALTFSCGKHSFDVDEEDSGLFGAGVSSSSSSDALSSFDKSSSSVNASSSSSSSSKISSSSLVRSSSSSATAPYVPPYVPPSQTITWGAWTVTTPATCDAAGVETRTASNGATETRAIAKLAWGNWEVTTAPTCISQGEETSTCPSGGIKTQTIAQLIPDGTQFCDTRDGKLYKFTRIVIDSYDQTWMAENLNYEVEDNSKCHSNSDANCNIYGRLYNWATAMGVCPSGWHLPSDDEWTALTTAVGESTAGTQLKATSGWNSSGNGNDDYGFSALPGGYGNSSGGFGDVGDCGYWWSASDYYASVAYRRYMAYSYPGVIRSSNEKALLFSVRCVKDN